MTECSEEHARIESKIDEHAKALEWHMGEVHADLMQRADILATDRRLQGELDILADALLGKSRTTFEGGGRDETSGIKWQVGQNFQRIRSVETKLTSLQAKASNGGFRTRLTPAQAGAVYVAGISAVASVIVALIGH